MPDTVSRMQADTQEQRGTWLMANEAHATRTYWLNAVADAKTFPADFPHQMISILWGGKIDYATFFDGSDEAVNGIQFFPVTPSLLTVVDDGVLSRLARPVSEKAQPNIWKTGRLCPQERRPRCSHRSGPQPHLHGELAGDAGEIRRLQDPVPFPQVLRCGL